MAWLLHRLAALLVLWAAWPSPALGAGPGVCFAAALREGTAAQAIAGVRAWDCGPSHATLGAERVVVRLPVAVDGRPAAHLRAGIGRFDRLELVAVDADGAIRSTRFGARDVTPLLGRPGFSAPLPAAAHPAAYYAVFTGATNRQGLANVSVAPAAVPPHSDKGPGAGEDNHVEELLLAVLIGLLVMPTIFDLAVYKALRKALFLWHAALTLSMALLVAVWSGLLLEFVDLSMPAWQDLLMIAIGMTTVAASMFTRSFAVTSMPGSRLPAMLSAAAWYSAALTAGYLAGWLDAPFLGSNVFTFALSPVLVLLVANLVREVRMGDRPSQIQVLGWVPLLAYFAVQLAADALAITLPRDGLPLLYAGVLVESLLSALGVSLRFLAIRRERDIAQARAHVMGDLAERDHLTGLLNRRAIDNRFEDLRARGYDTVALIDLDHFKTINDVSGHAIGDQVLEVTARVLASDPDNIAVRLGGEEFMILLRGGDSAARAEKLRRMLSVRVAREVNGLEQIVTASMGLLTIPGEVGDTLSFSSAYSRADLLLYEAKREGRNRTKAAHWQFFDQQAADEALAGGRDIRDRSAAAA